MLDNDHDYDNDNELPRDFCTAPLDLVKGLVVARNLYGANDQAVRRKRSAA
jgi:hypothetical protein